jgi:hypothetical protein
MTKTNCTTLIFIPTYNDFSHLQGLIDEVNSSLTGVAILVIDDGSEVTGPDLTNCLYVKLPFNLGLGVATQIALDYAASRGITKAVRIDADGQHPVEQIPALLTALDSADVVLAVRSNRHTTSTLKGIIATFARSYITLISRLTLHKKLPKDLNSGFIGLNSTSIALFRKHELDRYPEAQMMIIAASNRLVISSIDIDQNDRATGISSVTLSAAFRLLYRVTLYSILAMMGAYKP